MTLNEADFDSGLLHIFKMYSSREKYIFQSVTIHIIWNFPFKHHLLSKVKTVEHKRAEYLKTGTKMF